MGIYFVPLSGHKKLEGKKIGVGNQLVATIAALAVLSCVKCVSLKNGSLHSSGVKSARNVG